MVFCRYLDSIINLNYVLLRMLEKYSKNKNYMYVRKKAHKRAKQKKAKALAAAGDDEEEAARIMDEEEEEIEAAKQHYDEHQFEFEEYERVSRAVT
jgi:replication fork protection complex subunit Tof1/Swi1